MPKIFIITPVAVYAELWNVVGEMQLRAVQHPASVSADGGLGVAAGETGMGGAPSS